MLLMYMYMCSVFTWYTCTLLRFWYYCTLSLVLQITEMENSLADTPGKLTQAMSDQTILQIESIKKEKSIVVTKLHEEEVNNGTYCTM